MSRVYGILGISLLSFLPILLIQVISLKDIDYAAHISKGFAVSSVIFTLMYMAQRQYVNINGPINHSKRNDLIFRVINVAIASALTAPFLFSFDSDLSIMVFIILFKLSESVLDYLYGFFNFNYGFPKGIRVFLKLSVTRFFIVSISGIIGYTISDKCLECSLLSIGASSSLVFIFVIKNHLTFKELKFFKLKIYFEMAKKLFPYAISSFACSLLMMLPRWLVPISDDESKYFLVAFSISPIFGVIYNVFFSSFIDLSKKNLKQSFFQLLIIVFLLNSLFFLAKDFAIFIIDLIWKKDIRINEIIYYSISLGLVFNSSVLFSNYFKFSLAKFEFYNYAIGAITLSFSYIISENIFNSILLSSSLIFLISTFSIPLNVKYKNSH